MPMDKVRELIIKTAEEKGLSLSELSKQIGRNQTYIQQFITKGSPKELHERDRATLSSILGIPESSLRLDPLDNSTQEARAKGFTPTIVPGKELVGNRDFPIYAAAMGGDGHTIITFDAIDYVKRPAILENVKDAYGVYIVGDSMEPAYEQGDMALVHPHLPPARGKDVILFHVPPANEAECIIKRLVGFNDLEWKLRQYNPAKDFTEYRASFPYCHRVVGKYSGR